MVKKFFWGCVLLLLVVSIALRFYKLDSNPSILNRDEAALAYNGWLLAQNGTDEWGKTWPLGLESFGDYKLLGYPVILSVLFKFFPLSDSLVRVPAALSGISMVFLIALLGFNLVSRKKSTFLFSLFLAVTTPFLLFYSRIAFEAMVGLSLFVFAVTLLMSPISASGRKHWLRLCMVVLLFALAICTYNTPLLLLPAVIAWIPFWYGVKKPHLWWDSVLVLSLVFISFFSLLQPIMNRKSTITIFSDPLVASEYPEYRASFTGVGQKLLGNKYVYFGRRIATNTFNSFSHNFLVKRGGSHPWHQPPGASHLTLPIYLLALTGFVSLIIGSLKSMKKKFNQLWSGWQSSELGRNLTILYFLLLGLLPAVITVDAPHATRSLFFLTMLLICAVYAAEIIIELLGVFFGRKMLSNQALMIAMTLILGLSFITYLKDYWGRYQVEQPALLQSELRPLVQELTRSYPDKKIAIIDKTGYSYISVAWYAKLTAPTFFSTVSRLPKDTIGFSYGKRVGNYTFYTTKEDAAIVDDLIVEWSDAERKWIVTVVKM